MLRFYLVILSCILSLSGFPQSSFEEIRQRHHEAFNRQRERIESEFNRRYKQINEEYARMLEKSWGHFNSVSPTVTPQDNPQPVNPIEYKEGDHQTNPKPIPYDEVIEPPKPQPQPVPVVPIENRNDPQPVYVAFSFFGTKAKVRFNDKCRIKLNKLEESTIASAWNQMCEDDHTNLVLDCIEIRNTRKLSDWCYLGMLKQLSATIYGKDTNEAVLLTSFVLCQTGYMIRLSLNDSKSKLFLLLASEHFIPDYNNECFNIGGEMFYSFDGAPESLFACDFGFIGEKKISLCINNEQLLDVQPTQSIHRQSQRYPEMNMNISSNKNLIDFYSTYPSSIVEVNFMTRWAMYANTPMSDYMRKQLYPKLKSAIDGLDELTAANKLLNFVQTGFAYGFDDEVWGCDRAFFAEETLYYPFSDCEDHSILFTRLVRDLLGLRCVLIYYPGHLASAVEFKQSNVNGDYVQYDGKKFILADATYIGAPIGYTMPGMDNQTAKLILLN
ncbi:MAG: hypothetical protein IJU62_04280 [Muribaculaceae bacterium]|nr:hypothetical protein [Muribaculaceae bacterium]